MQTLFLCCIFKLHYSHAQPAATTHLAELDVIGFHFDFLTFEVKDRSHSMNIYPRRGYC